MRVLEKLINATRESESSPFSRRTSAHFECCLDPRRCFPAGRETANYAKTCHPWPHPRKRHLQRRKQKSWCRRQHSSPAQKKKKRWSLSKGCPGNVMHITGVDQLDHPVFRPLLRQSSEPGKAKAQRTCCLTSQVTDRPSVSIALLAVRLDGMGWDGTG